MNSGKTLLSLLYHPKHGLYLLVCLALVLVGVLNAQADDSKKSIQISSTRQNFSMNEGESHFEGNVMVAMDGGTQVEGSQADFKMDKNGNADTAVFTNRPKMVRQQGSTKQTIQADTLNMGLKNGDLQAQGKVVTQMNGDDKDNQVYVQANNQAFDQDKHTMRATGNVTVKKGDLVVNSPEALIFLNDSGAAERAVFVKGVHLLQGTQQMDAETITVKIDSGDVFAEKNAQTTVLSKDAQGKETKVKVTSYLQEIDKTSGTILANGNAVVDYDDYVAKGPKAVFYRINNNLDHIVMPGRAQIEDNERKVTGDTVVITMNPRQFNAVGNVTTFIKAKNQNQSDQNNTPAPASKGKTKAGGKGSKPITPVKTTLKPATTPALSKLDQELMIEKTTQEDNSTAGKTTP